MITNLIQNATLLVTLIVLYGLIVKRSLSHSFVSQLISGVLFGAIAVISMQIPIRYSPGIIYDGRTIVISLSALFGGWPSAVVSAIMALSVRFIIGGSGVWAGAASILSSALIGLLFRHFSRSSPETIKISFLMALGLSTHVVMLTCQLLLPGSEELKVIRMISLPVLTIFPATTVLLGILLKNELLRLAVESTIRQNEALYRTTLHSIGDAVITTDRNGVITYMNPIAKQLTGWKVRDALRKEVSTIFQIVHEDTGEKMDCPVKAALQEGKTIALTNHSLLISKSGERIPVADNAAPIRDKKGNISGAVLVFRDQIDERKKQKQIQESRERFLRAVENFPDLVALCDLNLKIQFVNEAVVQLSGKPKSFFIGKTEDYLWPQEVANKYRSVLLEALNSGESRSLKISFSMPESGEKYLDMTFIPMTDAEGKSCELMIIGRDFTREQQISEELHSKKVMYYALTEQSPVGIFRTDPLGYTTYVNPKWLEISGLDQEHALGDKWVVAVHPDDREELLKNWRVEVLQNQRSVSQYRFLRADGSVTWVLGEAIPEISSDGQNFGYIGTVTDITEQKKAEQALVQSRENFRQSMDESPLGMRILSDDGQTLYINKALLAIYGFINQEEYDNTPVEQRYTEESFRLHLIRKAKRKKGENVEPEYEITIKRGDGTIRYVHVYRKKLIWDGIPQNLAIYQDHTERKKAKDLLVKSENSLKESQEIAQIGSWEFDLAENTTEWSENCYRLYGLKPGEIIMTREYFRSRVVPEDMVLFDESYNKILKEKEPASIKFRILTPDGQVKWILNKIIPEVSGRELVKLRGINMDITESVRIIEDLEKAKNKAEESDRLKSAFLANMSHEIRTPLNTILGFSSILASTEDLSSSEKEEYSSIINRSSENLLQIINDILDISKMETGQLKIFNSRFDAQSVLDELKSVFIVQMKELEKDHINLRLISENTPLILNQDRVRFSQIFVNLLNNSIKFTEKGEICFGISAILEGQVSFFVSDTGIGIPKELQTAVFERFRQVNEGNTRIHGGTGLGLSIVKNLVELMGGTIMVESEKGRGTLFRFTLPDIR